jgi:hypothetical protein
MTERGSGTQYATMACLVCEDEQEHLYRLIADDFSFCGCGNPDGVYELVRDILDLAPFYEDPGKVRELIGGSDATYYAVLYFIDRSGLIEHGGSVGGSWLSEKGKHYLPLMHRHEYGDFDQQVGYPHDGGPCDQHCAHWQASYSQHVKDGLAKRIAMDPETARHLIREALYLREAGDRATGKANWRDWQRQAKALLEQTA